MAPKFRPPQGRLEAAALPRIVRDLSRARATGVLHLWNRTESKRIAFRQGDIVFAATNQEDERLGERLVRAGKIKRSVLDLSFRVMERSNERFGKTVVDLGWVSPMEMQRAVATQIKDIIYSVFTWHEGDYRFEITDDPVEDDLALELHTAEVIYEGTRRISDMAAIRAGVGSWKAPMRLAEGRRMSIPITSDDGYILSRITSDSTVGDVIATSPLGEEETLRRIYALLLAGVIEIGESRKRRSETTPTSESEAIDPAPPLAEEERKFRDAVLARYAALQFGNYYDRLGVDIDASGKKIRESYEAVVASLEPAAAFRERLSDVYKKLAAVRRKVREAYEVLSAAETRWQYDRSFTNSSPESTLAARTVASRALDTGREDSAQTLVPGGGPKKERAELIVLEAKRLYNGGDYFDAVASLNEALALEPFNGYYHRLLAQWLAQNPGCWEASQEHFEQAIELDKKDIEAYLGLAALHEEASHVDKASPLYERILTVDPDNRVAREKLEIRAG